MGGVGKPNLVKCFGPRLCLWTCAFCLYQPIRGRLYIALYTFGGRGGLPFYRITYAGGGGRVWGVSYPPNLRAFRSKQRVNLHVNLELKEAKSLLGGVSHFITYRKVEGGGL